MSVKTLKILFWITILIPFSGWAQKLNFRYYNVDEGLPQATVYDLYQDNSGYLWFGTQGGVAKFDGKIFEVFHQKQGLAENHVVKIYEDNLNNIWLGHRYEGVSRINGKEVFSYKDSIKELSGQVSAFFQSGNNLLIGTEGSGLFIINIKSLNDSALVYKHINTSKGLSGDYVYDFFLDKKGNIWIATDNGITIVNPDLSFRTAFYLNNKNKLPAFTIYDIELDERNYLWMATDRGVFSVKYDPSKWFIYETMKSYNKDNYLPTNEVRSLCIDKGNSIWIVSELGVGRISGEIVQWFNESNGLSSNNVSSVLMDREGNIWFGIYGTGACQYIGDAFTTFDKEAGLPSNMVQAVYVDNESKLWVGTDKGLCVYNFYESNKNCIQTTEIFTQKEGLINDNVRAIFKDSRNWLWIGTENGISIQKPGITKFVNLSKKDRIDTERINAINEDREGNIWLAGRKGGCYKLEIVSGQIKGVERIGKNEGLISDNIWTIFKNLKGDLLFGSDNAGLMVFSGGQFKVMAESEGLESNRPAAITEDVQGNIWLGTIGDGVIKYDILNSMRSGKKMFKAYRTNDGIGSDNPFLVVADNYNNIWIGTNYGVDRLNEKLEKIDHFGKSEGFIGVETNQNAAFKDKNGHLWFGTIKGVVKCKPELLNTNNTEPTIRLKNIRIFLKDVKLPENNVYEATKNHITFDFVGISLSDPNNLKYRYKLQGFDEDWSPLTAERFATYSNLPAGEFTFYVKAVNSSGIWSTNYVHYKFEVKAPFWKTAWFYILSGFTLLGLFYSIIVIRTKSLNRSKRKLELLVLNRTKELINEKNKVEKINKEVTSQKTIIEQKNKDITDSINYAKRIQNSLLPSIEVIQNVFPESFILFKPKDIVSGDFYWFLNINGKFIVAAVDCTGHGVPGAFMSVIGNEALNNVITDPSVNSPGQALSLMDTRVRKVLKQGKGTDSADGMDIALCAIDLASNQMQYSGAYRPLLLIRDSNIMEYKPDKISIGGANVQKNFGNNDIELKKDDIVYLFSDGYADQFGGENKKKMMTRRFKQLLLDIHTLSMKEQKKALERYFENWKGDLEQVDDVLVIGIRI